MNKSLVDFFSNFSEDRAKRDPRIQGYYKLRIHSKIKEIFLLFNDGDDDDKDSTFRNSIKCNLLRSTSELLSAVTRFVYFLAPFLLVPELLLCSLHRLPPHLALHTMKALNGSRRERGRS